MEENNMRAVKPFDMYANYPANDTSVVYIEIRTSPTEYPAFSGPANPAPPQRIQLATNTKYTLKTSRTVKYIGLSGSITGNGVSSDGRNWEFTTDNSTTTGLMVINV